MNIILSTTLAVKAADHKILQQWLSDAFVELAFLTEVCAPVQTVAGLAFPWSERLQTLVTSSFLFGCENENVWQSNFCTAAPAVE